MISMMRIKIHEFDKSLPEYKTLTDLQSHAMVKERLIEAERMEQRAETQYRDLATTMPGTRVEAAALSYLAELARRQSDWPKAVELLGQVFDKFPASEFGFRAAVTAAVIYRENLGDDPAADRLIEELKKKLTTVDETPVF